ncbi:hypothetical protein O181_030988 [Austropuccinia psidii MF-1]|uniref:Uncharacterized protein n=1 Tax=Austropuccinia psidii MF-1 TaxID=1389203 RepID=A0A9Q3H466_9BASI|nr:hypothetical protein [Austropuccinia psidii MF-1]
MTCGGGQNNPASGIIGMEYLNGYEALDNPGLLASGLRAQAGEHLRISRPRAHKNGWLEDRWYKVCQAGVNCLHMTCGGVHLKACGGLEISRCETHKWVPVIVCHDLGTGVNQPFAYDPNHSPSHDAF